MLHLSFLQQARLLAWGRREARWHIERRILQEKIPRSEQQCHWLGRHDWKVFWRREMRNAKCVPQHDICILNIFMTMFRNPFGKTLRRFARRLRDMAAGGMDLIVLV